MIEFLINNINLLKTKIKIKIKQQKI